MYEIVVYGLNWVSSLKTLFFVLKFRLGVCFSFSFRQRKQRYGPGCWRRTSIILPVAVAGRVSGTLAVRNGRWTHRSPSRSTRRRRRNIARRTRSHPRPRAPRWELRAAASPLAMMDDLAAVSSASVQRAFSLNAGSWIRVCYRI